jgi:hypothetical protein
MAQMLCIPSPPSPLPLLQLKHRLPQLRQQHQRQRLHLRPSKRLVI